MSTRTDRIRRDKPLRRTGGVPLSEPFRCLSGEFCSLNNPSTCSIFNRSSTLSSEIFGGSRGSRLSCRVSVGSCGTAGANPISFELFRSCRKHTPVRSSAFRARMRITSRRDADSDRDRVFIASVTKFGCGSRQRKRLDDQS